MRKKHVVGTRYAEQADLLTTGRLQGQLQPYCTSVSRRIHHGVILTYNLAYIDRISPEYLHVSHPKLFAFTSRSNRISFLGATRSHPVQHYSLHSPLSTLPLFITVNSMQDDLSSTSSTYRPRISTRHKARMCGRVTTGVPHAFRSPPFMNGLGNISSDYSHWITADRCGSCAPLPAGSRSSPCLLLCFGFSAVHRFIVWLGGNIRALCACASDRDVYASVCDTG
jgi:hypothetical protein